MALPSRCAYHVIYDSSLLDSLKYAAENDWSGIVPDFGVPRFSPERFSQRQREELKHAATEMNVEWGFHAPGDDVSLFSTYAPIREGILDYFRQIIDFARHVSASRTNLVVHAGVPPQFKKAGASEDDFTQENWDLLLDTLRGNLLDLIRHAAPDIQISLENYKWTQLIREVIEQLVPKGLTLCLDIPKIYSAEGEVLRADWEVFQRHCNAITVVHVHDWSSRLGSHQVVGNGELDFKPVLSFLSGIKEPLQYVFEVRDRILAQESLVKFEDMLDAHSITLE